MNCKRCGFGWIPKPNRRKEPDLCESCRARPALTVVFGHSGDRCLPHRGAFDREDNPMRDGELFLPGARLCNHRDCINPNHIE